MTRPVVPLPRGLLLGGRLAEAHLLVTHGEERVRRLAVGRVVGMQPVERVRLHRLVADVQVGECPACVGEGPGVCRGRRPAGCGAASSSGRPRRSPGSPGSAAGRSSRRRRRPWSSPSPYAACHRRSASSVMLSTRRYPSTTSSPSPPKSKPAIVARAPRSSAGRTDRVSEHQSGGRECASTHQQRERRAGDAGQYA